jgi:hypothetical protein
VLGKGALPAVEAAMASSTSRPTDFEVSPAGVAGVSAEMEAGGAVPTTVAELRRAKAAGGREQVDRFEDRGLAGTVGTEQQPGAGTRFERELGEVPEIAKRQALQHALAPRSASA